MPAPVPAVAVGGVELGLERPLVLLLLPVAIGALAYLVFGRRDPSRLAMSGRARRLLFAARLVVAVCLVVAAAGPYTATTRETAGEPRVTMLVDESASMAVYDPGVERLVREIEARGVPVDVRVVATGNDSRLGDALVANLEAGGSVLLVSDGQVTGGRSLEAAAELARSVNATVHALNLSTDRTERFVTVSGPAKTSVGVENAFLARVGGVGLDDPARLTVTVDGREVVSDRVTGAAAVNFSATFDEPGSHRIVATIAGEDGTAANDVFRKTVRVVEPPRVLYVARGEYPFEEFLRQLYDVRRAESVPANLAPYDAVVVQNLPAADLGNVDALQRFVVNGGGLVVVGGNDAYDRGGYANSSISTLLPVRVGDGGGERARIVLAVDVSGSTAGSMRVQKAIALDVLDQLGDDNVVGLVAFDSQPYRVVDPVPLATGRDELANAIRRLNSGGGTRIAYGLRGAAEMLGEEGGTVILISDGLDDSPDVLPVARDIGQRDVRVVTVGVGARINEPRLQAIAAATGGTYLRADETSRLRLLFGDESRRFSGDALTVVDPNHFITAGVEPRSNPGAANDVSVKEGADYLVATASGEPALAAWQYGLGRVVSVTTFGSDGTLDGLLARPDSLLLTKSVNWVVGDPERKSAGVVSLPDTRVGEPTRVTYVGPSRPSAPGLRFSQVAPDQYEATVPAREVGFESVLDAEYAVNYPVEYGAYGVSPALRGAVLATGGQVFEPGQAAAIAETVTRRARGVREVRTAWGWAFLAAALVVFLGEVAARRLRVYGRGRGTTDT